MLLLLVVVVVVMEIIPLQNQVALGAVVVDLVS